MTSDKSFIKMCTAKKGKIIEEKNFIKCKVDDITILKTKEKK